MGPVDRIRLWWQIRSGKEDTPLDGDTPAWLTSLVLHLSVLIVLTVLTVAPRLADDDLALVINPTDVQDEVEPEEVHFSEDLPDDVGALGFGGSESPEADALTEDDASDVAAAIEMPVETGDVAIMAINQPVAIAPDVSEQVLVKGVGSVGVTGAAGAIDRITHEILLSLEQRPTLVVWLFDQSGSLRSQREMIHDRLDRIYYELGVIASTGNETFARHEERPLLTGVMEFGVGSRFVLDKPTDDVELIKRAVREVKEDSSGREHVFQAILYAVKKYQNFRTRPRDRRNVLLVVFTDEAGDDIQNLDRAVEMCRRYAVPVYVVGVAAPFGRQRTFVKYVDPNPKFDQTPQWFIDQGPESLMPERVKLGFVGGPRLEGEEPPIDSGFGPFGLTRLCFESGGIYFAIHPNRNTNGRVTRFETAEMAPFLSRFFDPQVMRRYRPDDASVKEYHELLNIEPGTEGAGRSGQTVVDDTDATCANVLSKAE